MARAKYQTRLEELFSNIDPVEPAPRADERPERVETPADLANHLHSPDQTGWGEFLDGIRRPELLAYVYDGSGVKALNSAQAAKTPVDASGARTDDRAAMEAPIQVSGAAMGALRLEANPDQPWTEEDREVVDAVVQQLVQQVETLRLLDEAQRSRSAAEQALFRLFRQTGRGGDGKPSFGAAGRGGDGKGDAGTRGREDGTSGNIAVQSSWHLPSLLGWAEDGTSLGFTFHPSREIEALNQPEKPNDTQPILCAPIQIGQDWLGEIQVAGEQPLSQEDASLVETVTQRLSQQVESLRLLEESRHFRRETDGTIRRLTYESWQDYLASAEKTSLGFQYHHNQVLPLEPSAAPSGTASPSGREFTLRVRNEVIGRLAVDSPAVENDEAAALIEIIAERLGTHLDGLRLAEQREQALAETEMMYSLSSRLSTAQSLEEALSSVSEPARTAGARDSRLFFITLDERGQPEGLTLAAIWYAEDGPQIFPVSAHFMLNDHPAYWQILKNPGQPLLISDVLADLTLAVETRELFIQTSARAVAVLPLAISGRWVGAIFINWEQPHRFSEQENRLYSSLSRQAAVVVNNRLLLEQTRKRAQELQTVAQVSTAASTILDPLELLQSVVDLTKSSFSLYHVQIYLNRQQEGYLEVAAGSGDIGREIAGAKIALPIAAQTTAARAARERRLMIVNDTRSEPGFQSNPLLPQVCAEMALPMVVGEMLLGVFHVQASTANRFTREDGRIFTTLASQVAVALQNAQLYAEQAATVERLRELDHLKSAFLANMSHELRTPLNSILGFAEVLLLGLDGPLNETMDNDIRLIEKNGKHLLSLINDVLDMAKIEAGKMNLSFEKFMLRELLGETLDITSSLAREKSLYIVIAPDSQDAMPLVADRVRVRQVLINVIANAVKFTEKGGITLRAIQFPEERKLQIQITDTGIGIPPDKLDLIFDSFSQVDTSTTRKAGGTGLGLPISRKLVEMHGGRLWAESSGVKGSGSVFYIELPFEAAAQ